MADGSDLAESAWVTESARVTGSGGIGLRAWVGGPPDGPVVVLVHGYPDSHSVWDLVAERLAPNHRVVTYDVRGAGLSQAPRRVDDYRIEKLVADLAAIIEAAAPDRRVHLVGHDWGSIQCWSAISDPLLSARVASFTSISGPGLAQVGPWIKANARPGGGNWRRLVNQGVRSWYIAAFQTPFASLPWLTGLDRRWAWFMRRSENARVDPRWPGPSLRSDAINGVNLYRANLSPRAKRPEPEPVDVPVQLLVALRDPYVTPALLAGSMVSAPDLERHEIDSGHWMPRSAPDEVARSVARFVASHES